MTMNTKVKEDYLTPEIEVYEICIEQGIAQSNMEHIVWNDEEQYWQNYKMQMTMKKLTMLAAVMALLGSCTKTTDDTINPNVNVEGRTIYATFDDKDGETKTYVEEYKYLRWHESDEISFFDATSYNSQYAFAGKTGDADGEFITVATGEGTAIATTYGVYPYNANTTISTEGILSVELPAIQAYGVNSFGKGANTMVAVGESATDDKLFFKNTCGYLVVKLYNDNGATVKSVMLKGNNEEKIAGLSTITATYAGTPSVAMADAATYSITIDCGEGVALGTTAETATEFWFAIPEITFEEGITITAIDTEGKEFKKTTTNPVVIIRNNAQAMKGLNSEFSVPDTWKIYYTATAMVEPNDKTVFGANYVSNVWDPITEEGVIIFDGEITQIGENAFSHCSKLTSIMVKSEIALIGTGAFNGCTGLLSVHIPNGSATIDLVAFEWCTRLTSITLPNHTTSIGNSAFFNCINLVNITIPDDVSSIGDSAFSGCENLVNITIPDNVASIGKNAFENCDKLSSVTIGKSVTQIEQGAFSDCANLHAVYCKPQTPPSIRYTSQSVLGSTFSYKNSNLKIYVPRNAYSAYMQYSSNSEGWLSQKNWHRYEEYIEPYDFE